MWIIEFLISEAWKVWYVFSTFWTHTKDYVDTLYWRLKDYYDNVHDKARTLVVDNWEHSRQVLLEWFSILYAYAVVLLFPLLDLVTTNIARLKALRDDLYFQLYYYAITAKTRIEYLVETAYLDLQDLVFTNLARLKYIRDTAYWAVWEVKEHLLGDLRTYVLDYAVKARDFFLTRWDVAIWYWGDVYQKVKKVFVDAYNRLIDFLEELYSHLAHIGRTIYESLLETVVTWKAKLRNFVDNFERWVALATTFFTRIVSIFQGDFWARLFALLSNPVGAIWAWLWDEIDYYVCKLLAERW